MLAAVHYVAPAKSLSISELRQALRNIVGISQARVVLSRDVACRGPILRDAIIVLDLDGATADNLKTMPAQRPSEGYLVVVAADWPIPASWIRFFQQPEVQVLLVPERSWWIHPHLLAALRGRFGGLQAELVDAVNQRSGGLFQGLSDVVAAIIRDPRTIRRPGDLAAALRIPREELERRLEPLMLGRVEHVLTAVRWLAFEHLTAARGWKVKEALHAVGIRDRSNLRRQWRRAEYLVSSGTGQVRVEATGTRAG